MTERAVSIESNNADFVNELGSQLLIAGKTREAMKCFHNAMKLDETSVQALTGIISCQLQNEQIDEAAQQLEFLNEIQQSLGRSAVSGLCLCVCLCVRTISSLLMLMVSCYCNHFLIADVDGFVLL